MANGWADLGRVFGGINTDEAYSRGATRAAQLERLVADARLKQNEVNAQNELAGALVKLNAPADLATVFRAGIDPQQLSGYQGDVQMQDIRSRALDAPDWNTRNELLAVLEGKPLQLAGVDEQNLINNRYVEGGGGISTTEQGRSSMAANAARARASDASAASSYATADATRRRLALAEGQYDLQRRGLWSPGGASTGGAGAAGGGLGADWNPRQRTAVQGVQRNLLQYASALTGTPIEELQGKTADQIATLVKTNGGRLVQGGLARTLSRLPGGQLAGEVSNADILSYSQGAGSAWAAFENPTGIITNTDRESATAQMPNYLDPPEVQARKIQTFLEMSGYQPSAGAVLGGAGASPGGPPVQRARNPQTGQSLILVNGQWVPE